VTEIYAATANLLALRSDLYIRSRSILGIVGTNAVKRKDMVVFVCCVGSGLCVVLVTR
jgi:hypothetical protein